MHEMARLLHNLPIGVLITLSGLIGLIIGSFLTMVCYRLAIKLTCIKRPATIHLLLSRSFCPRCRHPIAWYDTIPVVSFCLNKGHCRHCQQSITWLYPAMELSTACLTTVIFLQHGLTALTLGATIICWWLLPLAVLDYQYLILPNALTLSLIIVGLSLNYFTLFTSFSAAVIGTLAGYFSLALIDSLYYLWRNHHGIGQGDWKFFAALGACFGWQRLLPILLIAAVSATLVGCGLILKGRATLKSALPFGFFLSLAGILLLLTCDSQAFAHFTL